MEAAQRTQSGAGKRGVMPGPVPRRWYNAGPDRANWDLGGWAGIVGWGYPRAGQAQQAAAQRPPLASCAPAARPRAPTAPCIALPLSRSRLPALAVVIYYGSSPSFSCSLCRAVYAASGPKWRLAHRFTLLPEWPAFRQRYKAVMWPDDDLVVGVGRPGDGWQGWGRALHRGAGGGWGARRHLHVGGRRTTFHTRCRPAPPPPPQMSTCTVNQVFSVLRVRAARLARWALQRGRAGFRDAPDARWPPGAAPHLVEAAPPSCLHPRPQAYDLLMAQPSLCPAAWSHTPWKVLYNQPANILRFTSE